MSELTIQRLNEERKRWRKDHPVNFYARPLLSPDNSLNMLKWEAGIPGPHGTEWDGGVFKVNLEFKNDYPVTAPIVRFTPPIFHPNVFTNGAVCLSILNADWKPGMTIKELLLGIQFLLNNPNPDHVTDRSEPSTLCKKNPAEYKKRIRAQTKLFTPSAADDTDDIVIIGQKRKLT